MRILFLACVLCAAGAQSAFAVKKASSSEIIDIQAQIFLGNKMDSKVRAAEIRLVRAKSAGASSGKVMEFEKALSREKDKQSAARTKAIHMTIQAYGLEPASWSGTSVMQWTKNRRIHWKPVAREREARQIQNAEGEPRNVKQESDYVGITYADGVTIMDPSAFENGPGFLASYLLHERIHFEQFTTDGKGNAMSYAKAQEEAYQAQVDNAKYFFDPKIPTDLRMMEDIEGRRDAEAAVVNLEIEARKGLRGLIRRLLPPAAPPDVFDSKVHTNAELADISGLVAQARAQADIARREREEREARSRVAAEKTAHDGRLKRTYADMAIRSCANPGSVTQTELDGLSVPYQENLQMSSGLPQGLDDCSVQVYMILRRGVDAERIRKLATPVVPARQPPPDPPIARQTSPAAQPIRVQPSTPFNSTFPRLKDIAVAACASPAQASLGTRALEPTLPYFFSRDRDDEVAARFSSDLGDCPRKLFYKLIETIRSGKASEVNDRWLRDMATQYSTPVYVAPPRRSSPTGCIPGDNSRRNCIACGNKYCG